MKKLTILLFSILISFNSYGEWLKVSKGIVSGDIYYVSTDTIKEHKGYVYWWDMIDYLKPNKNGEMSVKVYNQGDCGVIRYKTLSGIFYKKPMGEGSGDTYNLPDEWNYPLPDNTDGIVLKFVCNYLK